MRYVIPRRGSLIHLSYWLAISLLVLGLDYEIGPIIQFPAAFIIPVSLAAWYNGWPCGLAFAIALPLVRLYFTTILNVPWSFTEAGINAAIRVGVLGYFAILVDRVAVQSAALRQRVEILEGMLPICAVCKRIRGDHDAWQPVEQYRQPEARNEIAHEICPDCTAKLSQAFDRR
jgi:hypothetical protein